MTHEIVLVKAVQTSFACPSQWDAWDADGQYYYLRYRHGHGSVEKHSQPDWYKHEEEDARVTRLLKAAQSILYSKDKEAFENAWAAYWERYNELYHVAKFNYGDELDGCIELDQFCELAGLSLAPDIEYTSWGPYMAGELRKILAEIKTEKEGESQ